MTELKGLIGIPSMEEFVKHFKEESLPVTVIVTADKSYYKLNENESYYTNITQRAGKYAKGLIYGIAGAISMLIKHKTVRKTGAMLIGYGIGEVIDKLFINKQYVIVKKTDTGLEFDLEGFDASQNFTIFLNGSQVATGTTDANGSATISVNGTVSIEATEIAVICGSTTFHGRIPWNITPSTA